MKKSTKIGIALVGLVGIAAAASQVAKKYLQDDFYDEDDYVDDDQEFLEDYDELSEEDFADDGSDQVIVEKTERIVKPAMKAKTAKSAKITKTTKKVSPKKTSKKSPNKTSAKPKTATENS